MTTDSRALSRLAGLKKRAAEIRRLRDECEAENYPIWRVEQLEEQCRRLAEALAKVVVPGSGNWDDISEE